MRKTIFFFITILMLSAGAANPAQAQRKNPPRTVTDFYLLLPAEYIEPLAKLKNRRSIIEIENTANGYLRLTGKGAAADWEGWAEIALFRKTNGDYVVGVVNGDCATICYSGVEFLEYKTGGWTKVTKLVLPQISDKMILSRYKKLFPNDTEFDSQNPPYINYKLPQKGTTVILNANEGGDEDIELFKLAWNGAKFELKQ